MSEIFFYACEFIFNVVKVLVAFQLVEKAGRPRWGSAVSWVVKGITAVVIGGLSVLNCTMVEETFSNSLLWTFTVIVAVVTICLYKIKFLNGVSIIYFFWVAVHLVDFFLQAVAYYLLVACKLPRQTFIQQGNARGCYLLLFSLGVYLFGKWLRKEFEIFRSIKIRKLVKVILIPIVTMILIYFQRIYIYLISDDYMTSWMFFWLLLIMLVSIGVLYIQKNKAAERDKIMQMKVQLLENNYDHATKMYKEKATLLHDEKHHIRTIQEFLERGDTAAAIKYAGEMTEKLERSGNRVWSKHSLVDMMLNMKIQEAEKNHVRMDVSFDDMEGLILKEMDICTLLSNALDNAIEANQKITDIEERWIKVYGERKGQMWVFNATNPIGEEVVFEGDRIVTSKKDKNMHGFGLTSIRRVVENYDGAMSANVKEGTFTLTFFVRGFE